MSSAALIICTILSTFSRSMRAVFVFQITLRLSIRICSDISLVVEASCCLVLLSSPEIGGLPMRLTSVEYRMCMTTRMSVCQLLYCVLFSLQVYVLLQANCFLSFSFIKNDSNLLVILCFM